MSSDNTTSTEQPKLTYIELIDEGSKKFKYGLLWWFMYTHFRHGDYHYIQLLKLTEQEIHDKLSKGLQFCHLYSDDK